MRRAALAAALGLPAAQVVYTTLVRLLFRRNLDRLKAGDPEPLFKSYAPDVRFVFPGRNSWATEIHGAEELQRWVRRFVRVGLQLEPDAILVTGPPWSTRFCLHYTDNLTTPDGERIYANTGTIFGKIAWGKLTYYEVNEDTEKVAALDEWLAVHEPGLGQSAA